MPEVLEINDLSVEMRSQSGAPIRVVSDVSFAVSEGEIVGIVGASGCGKTTTLRSIVGRLPPRGRIVSGEVKFRGRNMLGASPGELRSMRGAGAAIVVQNPVAALNPVRTVRAQIAGLAAQHDISLSDTDLEQLMVSVGLNDAQRVLRSYPHELSGGMAQRVIIGAAIALRPEVILADEPTSALDVTVQVQIMELLREIVDERGLAAVFVSHDIALVSQYADRIIVMNAGRIVESGTAREVIETPSAEYTQELLAAAHPVDAIDVSPAEVAA